jgi:hypothetical protein
LENFKTPTITKDDGAALVKQTTFIYPRASEADAHEVLAYNKDPTMELGLNTRHLELEKMLGTILLSTQFCL